MFVESGASAGTASPPEPSTKFEKFLLKKGSILVLEFYNIGNLPSATYTDESVEFEVARAYTPGKNDFRVALRVTLHEHGGISSSGLMDSDEVESLSRALPDMKSLVDSLSKAQKANATYVGFHGDQVQTGLLRAMTGGKRASYLYLDTPSSRIYVSIGQFQKLQALVSKSVSEIHELSH